MVAGPTLGTYLLPDSIEMWLIKDASSSKKNFKLLNLENLRYFKCEKNTVRKENEN